MTVLYLSWDEWYTWWAHKDMSLGTEKSIIVPSELADEYFRALNAYHDIRDKLQEYVNGNP